MTKAKTVKSNPSALRYRGWLAALSISTLAVASVGCARDGYLYDAKAAQKGTFVFENAQAKQGSVVAVLADGERCAGKFQTLPDVVQMDQETGRVDREESQTGLAILECNAGHIVRCDFERDHGGAGAGRCSDTAGRQFELYFSALQMSIAGPSARRSVLEPKSAARVPGRDSLLEVLAS